MSIGTAAEQIIPLITESTTVSSLVYLINIGRVVSSLVAPAGAIQVGKFKCFAMRGILKKENISLIKLLKKVILPSCAPANSLTITPDKLYQPNPLAIAVLVFMEIPEIKLHTMPPKSDPIMIPIGIIKILI